MIFVDQNSTVVELGGSSSGSLMKVQSRCQLGLQSAEGLTGWKVCFQDGAIAWLLWVSLPHGPLQGKLASSSMN